MFMQKRLLTYLVLTFLAFSFSIAPLTADNLHLGITPTMNMNTCPATPPAGLVVTGVTSTTISIAWFSGAGLYYKIDVYDLTGGYGLSPMYTTGSSVTISNLTPSHDYQISVSASYCPDGPYGDPAVAYVTTGIIIIDGIVYIQSPCTPQGGNTTIPGIIYTSCVAISGNVAQPYSNAFIGQLTYQGAILHFGMAWEQDTLHIGKVGNQGYASDSGYTFHQISTESVLCRYNGSPLFTATFNANVVNVAGVDFSFMQQCTLSRCGAVSCDPPGSVIGNGDDGLPHKKELGAQPNDRSQGEKNLEAIVAPNPFSEYARVQYALIEPAVVEINLYDVLGKLVQTVQPTELLPAGNHETIVSGAGLPDGVYFLTVQTGSERKNYTLVKRE